MSIADELTDLQTYLSNAYDNISAKGGTIPQNKNMYNLADAILTIQQGQIVIPPDAGTLTAINVTQLPNKTSYYVGEYFNPAGCVVMATYTNTTIDVSSVCTFIVNTPLQGTDTSVQVSYEGLTTSFSITVSYPPVPAPASTIMLCHFDNSLVDEVTGSYVSGNTPSYVTGKFSTALNSGYSATPTLNIDANYLMNNDFTFELWKKVQSTSPFTAVTERRMNARDSGYLFALDNFSTITTSGFKMRTGWGAGVYPFASSCTVDTIPSTFDFNIFHHFAVVVNAGTYKVFVDGVLACHGNLDANYCGIYDFYTQFSGRPTDEFLVCKTAKYTANFTPNNGPYYL